MFFVTSDLHGYPLEKFKSLLDTAGFSECDLCYILGDVIDRGPEGIELLRWIMTQNNIKLILGNHEKMLLECSFLFGGVTEETVTGIGHRHINAMEAWLSNGGRPTLNGLRRTEGSTVCEITDYLKTSPLYYEINVNGKDFVLVHSGLGGFCEHKSLNDYTPEELLWTRPKITDEYFKDKTVVFGHTPTHFLSSESFGKALITPAWIDIDTGASCGNAPMLLRLDDMKEIYAKK